MAALKTVKRRLVREESSSSENADAMIQVTRKISIKMNVLAVWKTMKKPSLMKTGYSALNAKDGFMALRALLIENIA